MIIVPSENSRMTTLWQAALCGLAVAFAFPGCDMQTAGTSVGTGNPTEIEVSFKNDSGSVPITGTMAVYASTQIPVLGFSPEPLITLSVTGSDHASLKANVFASLADTLWPKSSIENGIYHFNVAVIGDSQGTILKGLSFRKSDGCFVLSGADATAPKVEVKGVLNGNLTPLIVYQGSLDTTKTDPLWDYHLFVYGTGFTSKSEHGRFTIQKLPLGQYECHVLLLPAKEHHLSGVDSAAVYGINTSLEPGNEVLDLGAEQAQVPLPDSLKIP